MIYPMEVDVLSQNGKGKRKFGKGTKGGKKGQENHSGKGYGETTTEHSRFEGECRNCGKYGHKAADCWYMQTTKSQGKSKGTGKSKSKVTEISESDNSKQVEETWTPNTSAPQSSLSQVNTIGCADEGLWIFSLEDSKKRRYTVDWEDQSCSNQTEEWKTEEVSRILRTSLSSKVNVEIGKSTDTKLLTVGPNSRNLKPRQR